ncbi:MAG: hypothetical protein WD468_00110 [Pirellulales bacterium]
MTINGHVRNGAIVLDEPCQLPEGAAVQVEVIVAVPAEDGPARSLYERLKPIIGTIDDLPDDASVNLDHYLYGHPKK